MTRIRFSNAAKADLREIAYFIRKDNPPRAISFTRELRDRCLGLATVSLRYAVISGPDGHGVRRAVHGPYNIFYIAEPDVVHIVRILHSARDYERLLFPDD